MRVAFGIVLAIAGCGEGVVTDAGVDGEVFLPVGVETVAPASVRAGQLLMVSCLLLDETGEAHTAPADLQPSMRFAPEGTVEIPGEGMFVPTQAGSLEVACSFPSLGLLDDTPAIVEVLPGDPANVVTHIDPDSIEAGSSTTATCEVFDAYGNRIEDAMPVLRANPEDAANTFDAMVGTFERAGRYEVFCEVAGADSRAALLEVRPGLPASLVISKVPDQPVYSIGQVIDIARVVADRFGNPIPDAVVPVVSEPNEVTPEPHTQVLGDGRFRYLEEGIYTLTATVAPPTQDDVVLTAQTTVVIDENGPQISCDDPIDGGILDVAPGGTITFSGSVSDLSGVTDVSVNGVPVVIGRGGTFSVGLTTRYGINFVDLAATDGSGREASRTCAFLVSDEWAPDTSTLSDTISLRLRQAAFDDNNRTDGLDSIADILATVLNSSGLRDTLHAALLAANPLKPSSCDQGGPFGTCILSSEVIYLDSQLPGPNTVALTLVDGGLRANVRIDNPRIRIRVRGRAFGIPYDTTGWVTFDYIDVGAIFDTSLSSGRPRMTVRPGSVTASVGSVSTNFSGLDGAVIDIVVALFQGRVRDMVRDLVRDYVTSNFDSVLEGVFGGLDVDSLGTTFDVARLDGSGNIRLTFGIGLNSLSTSSSRMLFGIGTRLFAPAAHARPTLGAPVQVGARRLDVSGTQSAGVAMHEAVLSQAVHALWRAGFLDATLDNTTVSGLPDGLSAQIVTGLPPVPLLRSDQRVELSLGAVAVRLDYPALFSEPVNAVLGARASMAVALAGEDLRFSDFQVEELYFSTDLASVDMSTRDTIEGFLRRLLERVMTSALDGALPAIPIPSFRLPASLGTYGLPVGAQLGISSPTLTREAPHFVLRGGFAVR